MNGKVIIRTSENGFIVSEDRGNMVVMQWVFETAQGLAEFIHQWGDDCTKKIPKTGPIPGPLTESPS